MKAPARQSMHKARKLRIWEARGGLCGECGLPVPATGPEVVYDHRVPIWLSLSDDDGGIWPLHKACDKVKTPTDLRRIAKTKRQAKMAEPAEPGTIKSRGFRKDVTRTISGAIKPRRPKEADMAKATETAKPTKKAPLPKVAKGNAGAYEFAIGSKRWKPGENGLKEKGPKGTGRMR